jgi:hypothetical protein
MTKWWIAGGAAVIALAGAVGAWMMWERPDPQVEQLLQLQQQVFNERTWDLPEAERDRLRQQFQDQMDRLSDAQREEVWSQMGQTFMQRMDDRIQEYFALPESERVAFLDREIDRWEDRRREWGSRQGGVSSPVAGGSGAPNRGGDGWWGRGPRDNSPEGRDARRRARLDRTTPEQRARRSAYFEALRERREQRGLPDFPGPR